MTNPDAIELGYAAVPWDVFSANDGSLDRLPPAPDRDPGASCTSSWAGTEPDGKAWLCTRPPGHPGTHRAGDSVSTVAEWTAGSDVALTD